MNPTNLTEVDVAIIGGGPAGAATALSIRHTNPALSVAIIDADSFDTPRVGESLPPPAVPLLRQLGVLAAMQSAPHLPTFSSSAAWGSAHAVPNEYFGQRHSQGWHLDRNHFDRMLLGSAQSSGASRLQSKLRTVEKLNGRWHLTLDQQAPINARFVVDASGRRAMLARRQGQTPQVHDQLVASVRFFTRRAAPQQAVRQPPSLPEEYADHGASLVEACEHGWWYSAFLPNQGMVVMAMTDADLARDLRLQHEKDWNRHLACAPYTSRRVQHTRTAPALGIAAIPSDASMVRAAHSQTLLQCTGADWLAVGDAASSVDPLSSQGILRALRFGLFASYAICDWFADKKPGLAQYETIVQAEFQTYLKSQQEVYAQERRWPNAPFWARRHANR